jgi:putative oxidoreductase
MAKNQHTFSFSFSAQLSLSIVRVAVGLIMASHGLEPLLSDGMAGLGGYLSSLGFPLGFFLAWSVVLLELIGGCLLAIGLFRRWISIALLGILGMGIVLVHGSQGWFVVGAGTNGMEFNVLLILCLLAIFLERNPNS